MKKSMPKLSIDLIPRNSFWKSVRSHITKHEWDFIRKSIYQKANYTCETCGVTQENYLGRKKGWLHCDEIWSFDEEKRIQILIGLRAICLMCHLAKHMGLAGILGLHKEATEHLLKINNWNREEFRKHSIKQWELWRKRSKIQWIIDYSCIEKYKNIKQN